MNSTLLVLTGFIVLAGYRVWTLRKRNISALKALGLGLDCRPLVNAAAGIFICMSGIAAVFLIEWAAGLLSITGVNGPYAREVES